MANKEVIINFKLNGVEQSTSSVKTLNGEVQNLNKNFTGIGATGNKTSQDLTTGVNKADGSVQNLNKDIIDLKGNVIIAGEQSRKAFQDLDDKSKNLGNNLNDVDIKSKQFGHNLEKSTKGASQGVNALANGLSLIGLQNDAIQKIAGGLQVLAGLMKAQEVLTKNAFDSKGPIDQAKSLGQLSTIQKSNITLTEGAAAANVELAVAEEGATVAIKGLTAAIAANPFGALLILIGLIITAFEVYKAALDNATNVEGIQKQLDYLEKVYDLQKKINDAEDERKNTLAENKLTILNSQLALQQAQGASLDAQYETEKEILAAKQNLLQLQVSEIEAEKAKLIILQKQETSLLNQQKSRLENSRNSLFSQFTDAVGFTSNTADLVKQTNEIGIKIKERNVDIENLGTKLIKIIGDLTASKLYDGKILDANNEKLKRQIELERESFLLSLQKSNLQTINAVSKIEFQADTKKFQEQIIQIQKYIDDFTNKNGNIDIIFETPNYFEITKLQDELLLKQRQDIQVEKESRDAIVQTFQDKIDAAKKELESRRLLSTETRKLSIEELDLQKQLNDSILLNEDAKNKAIEDNLRKNLDIRKKLLQDFDSTITKKGLVADSNTTSIDNNPDLPKNQTKFLNLKIVPEIDDSAEKEAYDEFVKIQKQKRDLFVEITNEQIKDQKKILDSTLSTADEKAKAADNILKLDVSISRKEVELDRETAKEKLKLTSAINAADVEQFLKFKEITREKAILLGSNDGVEEKIADKRKELHLQYLNDVKNETDFTKNNLVQRLTDFVNEEDKGLKVRIGVIQKTIDEEQKELLSTKLNAKERLKIEDDIKNNKQKINDELEKSNKEVADKQLSLLNEYNAAVAKAAKENTQSLQGKGLSQRQSIQQDVQFKLVSNNIDDSIANLKKELQQGLAGAIPIDVQPQFVDGKFSDLVKQARDTQAQLTDAAGQGSSLRIAFFVKEKLEIHKNLEEAKDLAIKSLEETRTKLLNSIKGNKSAGLINADEAKQKADEVNNTVDGLVSNTKTQFKSLGKELNADVKKILKGLEQLAIGLTNTILDGLQALEDAQKAKDEAKINRLNAEFELKQELYQADIEAQQAAADAQEQIVQDSTTKINQIEGQLSGARGQRQRYLLALLDEEKIRKAKAAADEEKAKLKAKEAQDKIDDAQKAKDIEIKRIQKEATIRQLKLDRTRTIVQGALASIEAFQSLAGIPVVGFALGAIAAAAVGVVTALQVDAINQQIETAQQLRKGGQLDYKMTRAGGGEVQGPSHEEGGVKGTGKFNNIEVEGGEFVVNKKATFKNLDIIKKLNDEGATKKFSLVPAVQRENIMAQGGLLPNFDKIEPAVKAVSQQQSKQDLMPIVDAISKLQIVVGVKQFTDENDSLVKIKQFAKV